MSRQNLNTWPISGQTIQTDPQSYALPKQYPAQGSKPGLGKNLLDPSVTSETLLI